MYPSLGPPIDRPHHGPSLKIHKGQAARGGTNELQWQLNLDFQPLLTAVRFFVLHLMRLLVGSARVRDIGRKSWPITDLVNGDQRRSLLKPLIVQASTVVILYFTHKGLN